MKKDAYFFSHDSNAREDEKIIDLRYSLGWEGYGLYWAIIEMLRDASDLHMQNDCKRLAFALAADEEKVRSVINDFNLFVISGDIFWSESLKKRLEYREKISEQRRKAAQKRWDSDFASTKPMQTGCKSSALKEKKGKKKEKKEKDKRAGARAWQPKKATDNYDWIDPKIWAEWIDHKRKVKAAVTERAVNANIKKLEQLGKDNANNIIAQSLDCGWKDLFPLKAQNGGSSAVSVPGGGSVPKVAESAAEHSWGRIQDKIQHRDVKLTDIEKESLKRTISLYDLRTMSARNLHFAEANYKKAFVNIYLQQRGK